MPDTKHTIQTYLMVILLLTMALLVAPAGAELVQSNGTTSIGVDQTQELKDTAAFSANKHVFFNVANDAGVKYNYDGALYSGPSNTYYMKFDGGGLNALHITSDPASPYGNVIASNAQSGTFFLSDTGGRGFDDDGILMIAVKGDVPNDFRVHIRASGYTWTPATSGVYNPTIPSSVTYQPVSLDETFTRDDLIYGPQNWKPCSVANYPIYNGQDMTNTQDTYQMMFVDLKSGIIGKNSTAGAPALTDNGAIRVDYSFENLNTFAAFDAFAWCSASNQGQGITWTNEVAAAGSSSGSANGYTVTGVPRAPVAAFTANTVSGPAPLSIGFTDQSTNTPTAWSWNFGDGTTSTEQNPSHTYTTDGTYSVALTASNAGGSNTVTRTSYITVRSTTPTTGPTTVPTTGNTTVPTTVTTIPTTGTTTVATPTPTITTPPLAANFTANVTAGQSPLAVQFTDSTTGAVQSYFWQFGDGGASYDRNPVHTYTTAGTYTVSLIVSGPTGTQVKTNEQYITVTAVVPTMTTVAPLTNYHHNYLQVSNTEGARFDLHNNGTYYQKSDGGGTNAIWMTGTPSVPQGQTINTTNQSGVFYLTDTGGRGFDDDGILMLAVNGTIPDDFKVHIRASGYAWTPIPNYLSPTANDITYVDGSIDEIFTKDDFIYGPQIWKPAGQANYPIYNGQNLSDTQNTFRLMFIDLRAGILGKSSKAGISTLQNNGAIKVEYSFDHLNTLAAFNAYAWCENSTLGEGISWTNGVNAIGQSSVASGYTVSGMSTSTAPITIPSATRPPTDPNRDGLYEDLNGDGVADFNDVVLFFNQMDWIAVNEPVTAFDFNKNGSVDFDDVVLLFNML
nr:PKD domain-containing protein [Methanosphaerula palustris]